jgi:hypothetical protein
VTGSRVPADATLARVFGAARAAAADQSAAEEATLRVFAAAGPGDPNPERLSAAAVRLVLRAAPAAPFAAMALADAEAVALTRLLGLGESRVAALLGVAPRELRRRLTRGLAAALPQAVSA